ncbi:MAG: hypothetical protein AB1553_00520 [Nitrospirota bacterium]
MAKLAIYNDEAKRLYVQEGLSLDAIVGILGGKVSRKTLYNWKIAGQWDEKRREYLNQTKDMYEEIIEIARLTIKEAKANPTPHNIYAMSKAIAALKQYQGVKVLEDETTPKERKGLTEDAVKEIETELGLL